MFQARRFLWLFFVLVLSSPAYAYIPNLPYVMNETASTHGKGSYVMDVEVSFHRGTDTAQVVEHWTIANGTQMGMFTQSPSYKFQAVYSEGTKQFVDETGTKQSVKLPNDFFENFFHIRSGTQLGHMLMQLQIIPAVALQVPRVPRDLKIVDVPSKPYVRLARTGGAVTIAVGTPSPADGSTLRPQMWIEQDRYVIRRLRLPSLAEVQTGPDSLYSRGLQFPRQRQVNWGDIEVRINTLKIDAVTENEKIRTAASANGLNIRSPMQIKEGPLASTIREFYSRFR